MEIENKIPETTEPEKKIEPATELKSESKTESKTESEASCCKQWHKKWCTPERRKRVLTVLAIAVVLLALVGYKFRGASPLDFFQHKKVLKADEAKAAALDFIDKNLVQPGTKVDITAATLENGLYKLDIAVGTQKITAYMTTDGSQFFPTGMDMKANQAADKAAADKSGDAAPAKPIVKSDKPNVKLFVMSYCPFGTQIEKGILPAVAALGSKINFTLEFVNYSMHNDHTTGDRKELDENLRQYCIQKNQPAKLGAYLTCFLKVGKGTEASCMAQAGVADVTGCMAQADTQFNVTKDFNDQSTYKGQFPPFTVNEADNAKYNVGGSPTLVINDTTADAAGRDSASLLKTICSAFNTPPAECKAQLSSAAPAAGFGDAAGSAPASNASCGS